MPYYEDVAARSGGTCTRLCTTDGGEMGRRDDRGEGTTGDLDPTRAFAPTRLDGTNQTDHSFCVVCRRSSLDGRSPAAQTKSGGTKPRCVPVGVFLSLMSGYRQQSHARATTEPGAEEPSRTLRRAFRLCSTELAVLPLSHPLPKARGARTCAGTCAGSLPRCPPPRFHACRRWASRDSLVPVCQAVQRHLGRRLETWPGVVPGNI